MVLSAGGAWYPVALFFRDVETIMKHYDLNDGGAEVTLAVVSDTHGRLAADVAGVVARCDAVVHAGDVCGAAVLCELASLNDRVIAVAGNNDMPALWAADEHDVVAALPAVARITAPGGDIVVEHGHRFGNHPDHAALRDAWPDARLVVYGHTHRQVVDQAGTPWVVNPGAAGFVRNQGGPHCLVLTLSAEQWRVEPLWFPDAADGRAA